MLKAQGPLGMLLALLLTMTFGCNGTSDQGSTAATRATQAVINAAKEKGFCPETAGCKVGDFASIASSAIQKGGPAFDQITELFFPVQFDGRSGSVSMNPSAGKVTVLMVNFSDEKTTGQDALNLLRRLDQGYGSKLCLSDQNPGSETLMQLLEDGLSTSEWPQKRSTFEIGLNSISLTPREGDGAMGNPPSIQISCLERVN